MKQYSHKTILQLARYLLVGGFNTLFGYGLFAFLNWLFTGLSSYSYLYASVATSLIAITVAFLGYKWFVFRTRGNYLIEWIRCIGVYSSSMVIGPVGLSILVPILRRNLHKPESAPYIAGAIMTGLTVIISFLGHRHISFRQKLAEGAKPSSESSVV